MSKFLDRFRYFKQKGETVWSPGKPSRLTVRELARTCQTMNLAAARAVPATPGIFTALTA